jgi:glyceraldehyde 3-phosphate dehydrogenase
MTVKVGINGFGRMGRLALRADGITRSWSSCTSTNANGPVESAAHLLEFDSVQGRWRRDIDKFVTGACWLTGNRSATAAPRDVAGGPWRDAGVDIVLEASGKWRTVDQLSPTLMQVSRRSIVAAPVKDGGVLNIVMGINDHLYDPGSATTS